MKCSYCSREISSTRRDEDLIRYECPAGHITIVISPMTSWGLGVTSPSMDSSNEDESCGLTAHSVETPRAEIPATPVYVDPYQSMEQAQSETTGMVACMYEDSHLTGLQIDENGGTRRPTSVRTKL